ncbi:uncharacterized protein LOC141716716 [Apium graveolens]|uniref:uncharacterized protein LOC141716716 n=1 Tax=Apium graveolens TaxID=4045 RepID=UPI003D791245
MDQKLLDLFPLTPQSVPSHTTTNSDAEEFLRDDIDTTLSLRPPGSTAPTSSSSEHFILSLTPLQAHRILERMPEADAKVILSSLSPAIAKDLLVSLSPDFAKVVLESISPEFAKVVLKSMSPVKEAKSCKVVHGGGRGDSSFSNSVLLGSQGAIDGSDSGKTVERRGGYGGPRTGSCGSDETRNLRVYERRSRTGRRNEYKRECSGQGNWGSRTDEISQVTDEFSVGGKRNLDAKKPSGEEDAGPGTKYKAENVPEEKDPEVEVDVKL